MATACWDSGRQHSAKILDQHQIASHRSNPREQKCPAIRRNRQIKVRRAINGADEPGAARAEFVKSDLSSIRSRGVGVEIVDAILNYCKCSPYYALQYLLFVSDGQSPGEQRSVATGLRVV